MKPITRYLGVFVCTALSACASGAPLSSGKPFDLTPPKTMMADGIFYSQRAWPGTVPMQVAIVEIDLQTRGLSFAVSSGRASDASEYRSQTTSTFLRESGAIVAINGGYFSPVVSAEGLGQDAVGFAKSNGRVVSPASTPQTAGAAKAVVCFDRRQVQILAALACPDRFANGLAAGPLLVQDGAIKVDPKNATRHPRSILGINASGNRLWLVTIDGRQKGYSEGASFAESALILQALGAAHAINLDGGGSTALVYRDPVQGPRVLNRPIQGGVPGTERPVATHIGVFTKAKPKT
ncbi:phosphodiester glycosidase family protein [Aquidulcibacter sp.]|uniref:phosphodiester glycosidase family protein n=1 Tax=Aquidulcibacter sp. TaxID=2052990 RepID=UPI0028AD4B12|nr:phosphodiester glycosidase family protein [Aquidulcibacter sp.]